MIRYILIILLTLICLSSYKLNKQYSKPFPTQEEINNSDLFYEVLNLVFNYIYEEKKYSFSTIDGEKKIRLYDKAEVQKWSCYFYKIRNFYYHYSNIDTTNSLYNTRLKKSHLLNICKAVHNPITLSKDEKKYKFAIDFSDRLPYEFKKESPWYISPVIESSVVGRYEVYLARAGVERSSGHHFILDHQNGKFLIKDVSMDPQDGHGCWSEEDYINSFCSSN